MTDILVTSYNHTQENKSDNGRLLHFHFIPAKQSITQGLLSPISKCILTKYLIKALFVQKSNLVGIFYPTKSYWMCTLHVSST